MQVVIGDLVKACNILQLLAKPHADTDPICAEAMELVEKICKDLCESLNEVIKNGKS